MVCMTDMALLHGYLESAEGFFDVVKRLSGRLRPEEFDQVIEDVQRARAKCILARETMEEHRRKHGCRSQAD